MRNKHVLEEPVASTIISHRFSHMVWSSVFAAVTIVIVSQLVLALLGSSIGLSVANGNNIKGVGIGAGIWWIISGCISFYLGGLVAGRMAGIPRAFDGMVHGLVTWSVTTIATFLVLTSTMGAVISGGFGMLKAGGQAVSSMAPQVGNAVQNVMPQPVNDIQNQVRQMLQQHATSQNPAAAGQLMSAIAGLSNAPDKNAQKQQIVGIITQNTNVSRQDATSMVNQWDQNLQQGVQKAEQTAQDTSKAAGKGAFASFVMLVLGAVFCGWGGSVGAPHWSEQEIA